MREEEENGLRKKNPQPVVLKSSRDLFARLRWALARFVDRDALGFPRTGGEPNTHRRRRFSADSYAAREDALDDIEVVGGIS